MAMLSPIGLLKSRAFRLLQYLALAVGLVAMPVMTVPDLGGERACAGLGRALVLLCRLRLRVSGQGLAALEIVEGGSALPASPAKA